MGAFISWRQNSPTHDMATAPVPAIAARKILRESRHQEQGGFETIVDTQQNTTPVQSMLTQMFRHHESRRWIISRLLMEGRRVLSGVQGASVDELVYKVRCVKRHPSGTGDHARVVV
jgi:hypothetical protein